ncbi:hypothetical protein WJX73_006097 [Symbiochloris irregularis]|uniref:Cation/H+ exchanger transmembrane domain-containing protein n=1 Tax=Symbiochloris irregularis TaxID=706552 RepID=A0AAW1NS01_9CHLO
MEVNNDSGPDAIFVAACALVLGLFNKVALRWTRLPNTVLQLGWGLLLGIGNETWAGGLHYLGPGITAWQNINPARLSALFLPPLLFAGAVSLPGRVLLKASSHIALLGIGGVLTGSGMTAVVAKFVLPYDWTWLQSLLFGAIVAATDPVAAVALLKEVRAPEDVRVTVDGEALLDDGVAAVLYTVFLSVVEGERQTAGGVIKLLFRQSLGGPAVGIAFAIATLLGAMLLGPDACLQSTLLLAGAYGCFVVAEDVLHTSGILAVVAMGMSISLLRLLTAVDRVKLDPAVWLVWEFVEFVANSLAFVMIGILVASKVYQGHHSLGILTGADYGWAVLLWLLLLVIRVINLLAFWPIMVRTGYGTTFATTVITAWSGIRGLVGLVLALSVLDASSIGDKRFQVSSFYFMATTLVLTTVVQGSSYSLLLKVAGQSKAFAVESPAHVTAMPATVLSGTRELSLQPGGSVMPAPVLAR